MTRSHAKNTHTQSILSQSERAAIRGETSAKRLGAESFKRFDACYLCLSTLVDPVSCLRGHFYCRECALSNLISQKASIEVQKREMAQWEARDAAEREEARRRARERVLSDFERGMGLGMAALPSTSGAGGSKGSEGKGAVAAGAAAAAVAKGGSSSNGAITKSAAEASTAVGARLASAQLSAKDIEAAAQAAEEKALVKIAAEQLENRKAKMPSFWLPSLAPDAMNGKSQVKEKDVKLQTVCLHGEEPHPFSRKTLLPVHLHYPPGSKTPHCPSCARELSNSNASYLLSSRSPAGAAESESARPAKKAKKEKKENQKEKDAAPYVCGHVVCKTCVDTIVKPAKRCCVCEAGVGEAGMIPVGKEGTGFAAAGGAEVRDSSAVLFRMM